MSYHHRHKSCVLSMFVLQFKRYATHKLVSLSNAKSLILGLCISESILTLLRITTHCNQSSSSSGSFPVWTTKLERSDCCPIFCPLQLYFFVKRVTAFSIISCVRIEWGRLLVLFSERFVKWRTKYLFHSLLVLNY